MAFTYTPASPDDITRLRARIGDRKEIVIQGVSTDSGIRSDEEIEMWIADEGSWQKACIAWVQSVLNQINLEPDSTADWLEIDFDSARTHFMKMLDELKTWLGVSGAGNTTRSVTAWRPDSNQTQAPDY